MALVRFKAAVDYVVGYVKAFGDNSGFIQAVTLVDSTGADASATLPTGAATSAKQDTGNTSLASIDAKLTTQGGYLDGVEGLLTAIAAKQISGPSTAATSQSVTPSTDQNPIFDHTNGTKTSVTTSATVITTGAGHTFLRISTDADIVVNTAGATAVDDGTGVRIVANLPETIPVPPSTAIKALSLSGTAVVRCTPLKVR